MQVCFWKLSTRKSPDCDLTPALPIMHGLVGVRAEGQLGTLLFEQLKMMIAFIPVVGMISRCSLGDSGDSGDVAEGRRRRRRRRIEKCKRDRREGGGRRLLEAELYI